MASIRRLILHLAVLAMVLAPLPLAAADPVALRIGWQKGSNLSVTKARGLFDKRLTEAGVTVSWIEFPAGPQMLEGLNVGSIDLAVVGETPPVIAQAAGADMLYAGAEPPSPRAEAILIPANSPVKSVADLKGKKVALNKGSNVHFLLVRALEKAGLAYGDIQTVFLKPSDARAAFESGSVDAWVIWDPYASAAVAQTGARVLIDGSGGTAENYNFYIATRAFAEHHPDVLKRVLEGIRDDDLWISQHLPEAAAIVAPQIGLPEDVAATALSHYAYGAALLTPAVAANQQRIADAFAQLGLIPKKLDIDPVVWRPAP